MNTTQKHPLRQARPSRRRTPGAFSLIEILIVIALISLLATFSMIAFSEIRQSSALTANGLKLVDSLNLARQLAVTHNSPVEVRFYELADPTEGSDWRAFELLLLQDGTPTPHDRVATLSPQVRVAREVRFSNLLDESRPDITSGTGSDAERSLPGVGTHYRYRGFTFLPDGSTTLASSVFITLKPAQAPAVGDAPAANWFSIHVDATHGAVRTFQP